METQAMQPDANRKENPKWLEMLSRSMVAIFGGYAVTYCITAFLSVWLPMAPVNNVFVAGMLAFIFYTAAVIYAFAARDHKRVWIHFIVAGTALALAAFLPDMTTP